MAYITEQNPLAQNAPPPTARILVVDDEEHMRTLMYQFLTTAGYRAVVAADGREALAKFRRQPFDLLLSDVKMPELDGLKLLRAVKDLNPRVPVVLISGYADIEMVVEALKAGAENFLPKPVKLNHLAKVVEQCLGFATRGSRFPVSLPQIQQITELRTPSAPEYIREIIYQLAASAVAVGFCQYDLDTNIKLVLHEAITNAMEHGNGWDQDKQVAIRAEADREFFRVSIADQGPGFDLASLDDPVDKDPLAERGRGIFLMKAVMDEVTFTAPGNQVILCKFRACAPKSDRN